MASERLIMLTSILWLALWFPGEIAFILVPVLLRNLDTKQKPFLSSVAVSS
jgi:hypothetical protein